MKASLLRAIALTGILGLFGCGGPGTSDQGVLGGSGPSNGANGVVEMGDDESVRQLLGVSLAEILSPVSSDKPTGESLAGSSVYREISEARREDDPSLPLGAWSHELKRADWQRASALSLGGLAEKSKDLQLAMWLLEAEVQIHGLKAFRPCFTILRSLVKLYWEAMFPLDMEIRANVFRWADSRMPHVARLLPVTVGVGQERAYNWQDYEQAIRIEQIIQSALPDSPLPEGPRLSEFNAAVAATPVGFYRDVLSEITDARNALQELKVEVESRIEEDLTVLDALDGTLESISLFAYREIRNRK